MEIDSLCHVCEVETETLFHAFFGCCHVVPFWFASPLSFRFDALNSYQNQVPVEALQSLFTGLAAVWERSNQWLFDGVRAEIPWILQRCQQLIASSSGLGAVYWSSFGIFPSRGQLWVPTGVGLLKLNFDAAFDGVRGAGFGFVVRDGEGSLLAVGCGLVSCASSSLMVETICFRWAIQKAIDLGLKRVIF
ncbi:uncharacterized protein LOC130737047 [Lotus japonicus]|uniref:uncharacterized protein LOC130737047 n=1 Tax=Lotus japonicus TaxID=34305 RepID=UPI0025890124|nr:uncharacterized protein LOC130737047 [Lotus japonicus]